MTLSQREEARRGRDWLKTGMRFFENENYADAKEAFALAKEHLDQSLMTDAELLASINPHTDRGVTWIAMIVLLVAFWAGLGWLGGRVF